jgi:rhodanese-related sulfurtransferase
MMAMVFFGMKQQDRQQAGSLSTKEVFQMMKDDTAAIFLDVRTVGEYMSGTGHLQNAILIPIQELDRRIEELTPYKDKTIIAYCRTGNRSGYAAQYLAKNGFRVFNMEGGIVQWNQEKLPVVQGTR